MFLVNAICYKKNMVIAIKNDVYYEKNLFYTVNFSAFLVNFAY